MTADTPLVLALVGQTASGKNRLAVEAATARDLPVEVISLDSMKVYRGMDVGTAKPPAELRARIPHHLLDVADPTDHFDAARWRELADEAEAGIRDRGRVPLYVGGTGMYLQLLVYGHFRGPGADDAIRDRLRAEAADGGPEALHRRLAEVDPAAAARIHPNDEKRVVRALEVFELTGQPISAIQTQADEPRADRRFALFGLRWPVAALDERINRRCAEMFAAGWVDEVRRIRDAGGFGDQAEEALGYREILAQRQPDDGDEPDARSAEPGDGDATGRLDAAQLLELVQQRTRRFARKQMTWFRRFPIHWFDLDPAVHTTEDGYRALVAAVAATLESALT